MRGLPNQLLWWVVDIGLGLLLWSALLLTWMGMTESGSRFATELAIKLAGLPVHISAVDGQYFERVTLRGIVYSSDQGAISIDRLTADWDPAALLRGELRLHVLAASGITLPAATRAADKLGLPSYRLPLEITIEHLQLADLFYGAGSAAPAIERLTANVHLNPAVLKLEALSLITPRGHLQGKARLAPHRPYTLQASASWSGELAGLGQSRGQAHIQGDSQRLEFRHDLQAPGRMTTQGQLTDLLDQPRLSLRHRWQDIAWPPTAASDWFSPTGSLVLNGWLDSWSAHVDARMLPPDHTEPVQIATALTGDQRTLQITAFQLARRDGQIRGRGELTWAPTPTLQLDLDCQDLAPAWPIIPDRIATRLTLQGAANGYRVNLQARTEAATAPLSALTLHGYTDLKQLTLAPLTLQTTLGRAAITGRLDWADQLAWQLQLQGNDLSLAPLLPTLQGHFTTRLVFSGSQETAGLTAEAVLTTLTGQLNGQPLRGSGRGEWTRNQLRLDQFTLAAGNSRLRLDGSIGQAMGLTWQAHASDLSWFRQNLAGQLRGDGEIAGTPDWPRLQAEIQGQDLRLAGQSLGDMALTIDSRDKQRQLRLSVTAADHAASGETAPSLPAIALEQAELRATVTPSRQQAHLQATTKSGSLNLAMQGAWHNGSWQSRRWQGQITQLDWQSPQTMHWSLQRPAKLRASTRSAAVTPVCLHQAAPSQAKQAGHHLCLQGSWSHAHGLALDVDGQHVPLAPLGSLLPANWQVAGTVDLAGEIRGSVRAPAVDATIRPAPGRLTIPLPRTPLEPLTLAWEDTVLFLEGRPSRWRLKAQSRLPKQAARVLGDVQILRDDRRWLLGGQLRSECRDLAWLAGLTPQLANPSGQLQGRFAFGGTLTTPAIGGELRLEQARVSLPASGITLTDLDLHVRSSAPRQLTLTGRAVSGSGQLRAAGELQFPPAQRWSGHITLQGEQFEAVDLPHLQVVANPNLAITPTADNLHITGDIVIPKGHWQLGNGSNGGVKVSADEVIVAPASPTTAAPDDRPARLPITSKLTWRLGEAVRFHGRGLETRVTGRLQMSQGDGLMTAEGVLQLVDGRYEAYGQALKIQDGRLIFQGPIDNPAVDALAARQIKEYDVVVGIDIGGTLQDLQSELFALPEQPKPETLSLLLTGKPLARDTEDEAFALIDVAAQLGIASGDFITDEIASQFGLDQLTLAGGDELTQTSLLIGKYLTPDLYVSYAHSLFEEVSILSLQYALSKHLTLEALSGETSSMDVIYHIEHK